MKGLFKQHSYNSGMAINVASTAVWKLVSFANSVLIAFYFGTGGAADLYFYLIILVGFGVNLLMNVNTNVIIPHAMHLGGKEEEFKFLNWFILLYMFWGAVKVAVCAFAPGFWLALISRFEFAPPGGEVMLVLAMLYFASLIITQFLINILERHRIFGVGYLYPLNSVVPFLLLVFFHNVFGINAMLCGFIIAAWVQAVICLVVMLVKLGWRPELGGAGFNKIFRHNLLSSLGSEVLLAASSILPVFLMSGYGGIISAYNYSKQLLDSPTEIITNRVAGITRIKFNELCAEHDNLGLETSYFNALYLLLFLMTPIVVFTVFFAPDIIKLFFQRGKFTADAADNTVLFVRLFMPSVILMLPSYLQRNLAAGARKLKEFFYFQLISLCALMIAVIWFIKWMGPFGYPLAFFAGNALGFVLITFVFMPKHFGFISGAKTVKIALGVTALAAAGLAPAYCAAMFNLPVFFKLLLTGSVYVASFAGVLRLFYRKKFPEIITTFK